MFDARRVAAIDVRIIVAIVAGALSTACASTGTIATPRPFPNAPLPPLAAPMSTSVPGPESSPIGPGPATSLPEPDALVQLALGLQGVPYRLGGEEPGGGFDCSGLVRYVFEQYRVDLPRTVAEQYQSGRRVKIDDVQAGDLLFFSTIGPGATHVGIALGPAGLGEFVHAPGEGGAVRVEHFDAPYWRSRLVGVRRLF
jgi:cell wall-associated NlpC family hydrolase